MATQYIRKYIKAFFFFVNSVLLNDTTSNQKHNAIKLAKTKLKLCNKALHVLIIELCCLSTFNTIS